MTPSPAAKCICSRLGPQSATVIRLKRGDWPGKQGRPGVGFPVGRYALQVDSPCHVFAKHSLLDTCFLLTAPFSGMLLTMQSGLHG